MGDYGFRTCSVCGKDVLWEEAHYMRENIVCCCVSCYDRFCGQGKEEAAQACTEGPSRRRRSQRRERFD